MVALDDIRSAIADLAPAFGVSRAFVFGSYARGEQSEQSDVDIVVDLNRPLGFKRAELHDELEARLGLPVDLIFGEHQLYEPIRHKFNEEKVLIYAI